MTDDLHEDLCSPSRSRRRPPRSSPGARSAGAGASGVDAARRCLPGCSCR